MNIGGCAIVAVAIWAAAVIWHVLQYVEEEAPEDEPERYEMAQVEVDQETIDGSRNGRGAEKVTVRTE